MKRTVHVSVRHRAVLAVASSLAALLLAACIAPAQESESRIDAPIRLQFEVDFGSAFGDQDEQRWPEFSLVLSAADADALGSDSTVPFVYGPNDRQPLAKAVIRATNFVVETEDSQVEVPCFVDPVVAVVAATGTRLEIHESGFCPQGRAFESITVDADVLLEALQE